MQTASFLIWNCFILAALVVTVNGHWWSLALRLMEAKAQTMSYAPEYTQTGILVYHGILTWMSGNEYLTDTDVAKYCEDSTVIKSSKQRHICQSQPNLVRTFARASEQAMVTCMSDLWDNHWNCSVYNTPDVYGNIIHLKNPETAYVYALNAAATVYQIIKECEFGTIKNCSCTIKETDEASCTKNCADAVDFAYQLSQDFVDSQEHEAFASLETMTTRTRHRRGLAERREKSLMNLHNNQVGRLIAVKFFRSLLQSNESHCRTHSAFPDFDDIARAIFDKYKIPTQITAAQASERSKQLKSIHPSSLIQSANSTTDVSNSMQPKLVYLARSLDYCHLAPGRQLIFMAYNFFDKQTNSRQYIVQSERQKLIAQVCCGRGYKTVMKVNTGTCECDFNSGCPTCTTILMTYYCD